MFATNPDFPIVKSINRLKAFYLSLAIALGSLALSTPVSAQLSPSKVSPPSYAPNQLLVLAHNGADQDEVTDALKAADGTILKTLSNGRLKCYLIQVSPGKLDQSIKKLSKDKQHFDTVSVNAVTTRLAKGGGSQGAANDPGFTQQYHLGLMNVPTAWSEGGNGRGVTIGVIDGGVQGTNADLFGRVDPGLNIITGGHGNVDTVGGHGTFCATLAAATTNNARLGASPAMNAYIIPVDVFNGSAVTYDDQILAALFYLESRHVKLINLSINAPPPNTYASGALGGVHAVAFAAFTDFFRSGGLLFNGAGNSGTGLPPTFALPGFDSSPRTTSLIVVSAINANRNLADFSTYGNPVWFTAPGASVGSSYENETFAFGSGTSFSTPLALSVAAEIWGRNPGLTNQQVLDRMVSTTSQSGFNPAFSSQLYGFGVPDAGAALAH